MKSRFTIQPFRGLFVAFIFASSPVNAQSFSVCFEHGCASSVAVTLGTFDWQKIRELFAHAENAESERAQIAKAIALLETIAAEKIGAADRGGTGLVYTGQMDCIDESINTTTYLTLFMHTALLRWHRVEKPATRGWLLFGWPHTTAVMSEPETQQHFAVDSWFYDNGTAPVIVPLEEWKKGWKPREL